ncbi:rhomboid family intramembrane serine protease [Nonomuraea soli]|uniref:Membrane associated rhomboid family serine protease n=1 Tax=Nonomuraea soli TaxID=1032476 RepID=A0A7W0CTV6_9ACTN|nr:rhomboid family intramembrane serine protease [Nonomuraea soli]MBA2897074.1 membrane associated rhomboid family serine protease [Nonomuraea soli]
MASYSTPPKGWRAVLSGALGAGLILLGMLAVMWVLEGYDYLVDGALDYYGITGWDPNGLVGILFAPFLHGGFGHLMANSLPFLILGFFTAIRGLGKFFWATAIIILVGGLGTWISSPGVTAIGASGLIFGYFGYILARGLFDRSLVDILIALGVGAAYYSMLAGVLPNQPGISWQGHLFGFLSGIVAAWVLRRKRSAVTPPPAYPAI